MNGAGELGQQSEGPPRPPSVGRDSRYERRSVRCHAQRRRRTFRLFCAVAPAATVIVVVAVLFPLLASPGPCGEAGTAPTTSDATNAMAPTTTMTGANASMATATSTAAGPAASDAGTGPGTPGTSAGGLLLAVQDGTAAVLVLVSAGSRGDVVLRLPGIALPRWVDRFTQLAGLCAPQQEKALSEALTTALAVPVGPVASVEWADLRAALAGVGAGPLPSRPLDATGDADQLGGDAGQVTDDAAQVAAALAAVISKGEAGGPGQVWEALPLGEDADGFRTAIPADLRTIDESGWTGQAITGAQIQDHGSSYFEPDIKTARSVLAGTGMGG